MPRYFTQHRALFIAIIFLLTPFSFIATSTQSNWSGPPVVDLGKDGGNTTVTGFSVPEGETILDAWLEIGEDSDSELGTGTVWRENAQSQLNFSWGLWNSTTTNFFDGALSLDANHSVGRINDFENLVRTLQDWEMGGTQGIWQVSDMLGIPGQLNGSARESSGGLIPIGAVTGRYILATKADQSLPNGVHTWMESPDYYVPPVINNFNLSFSHWYHMYTPSLVNGNADGVWVEMSLDGGQSWRYISPDGGYDNHISSAAPAPNGTGGANFEVWASPNASGWLTSNFHLDNELGIANSSTVRFRFVAWTDINSSVQRPGWFIDNMNLTNDGYDGGAWFHGNLTNKYLDGAKSYLLFEANLSNASGPIMLDYATDFDMEGDIYDNFHWEWSLDNSTWTSFSANMPGFGVLIGGQMYIDDSRGWKHLSHPLPQSLAGNSTVYIRVYLETDNFPGSGYGGTSNNPPEGLFLDDIIISSGTIGNKTTHLNLNLTDINDGNIIHGSIGGGHDEWQHLSQHGVNGPTYQYDSFENSPLLPIGWDVDTIRGSGWEFRSHDPTWVVGPNAPSNGTHYAGIVFGDLYQPDSWTHLISPEFIIPANSHARISFKQFVCAEQSWDGGVMYISNDDGRNWIPYGMNEPDFYDTQQNMNPASEIYGLWAVDGSATKPTCHGNRGAGVNKDWVTKQADVSQFGGQSIRLRFSFFTDPYIESDGWYLDDVGLYVDWFEEHGTWISDPIETNRNSIGTINVDASVPNGTWVKCTLLNEDGTIIMGMNNLSFPVIPTPGLLPDKIRIKLEMGTNEPELTPKIHALYVGAVSVFSSSDTTNGWSISPHLVLNKTSNNLSNPNLNIYSANGPLIYGNNPIKSFEISGFGAGVFVTLSDQAGTIFFNGLLSNRTVQRTTPLAAYKVQIDLQPGGWLQSLTVKGRLLQPGNNVTIDIGDDGSVEWAFIQGNDGRGQMGWQDSFMQVNSRSQIVNPSTNVTTIGSILIPDDAIVTGGLVCVRSLNQSASVNLSIGSVILLNQLNVSTESGVMVPLSQMVIQSINNQVAVPWANDFRNWKQVPVNLETTGPTEIVVYGINYELAENLTGLEPILSTALNNSIAVNGMHDIPINIKSDGGGVSFWGGVEHAPLISDEIIHVPQTWLPDRTSIVTTEHTHLFSATDIVKINLSLQSSDGSLTEFSVSDIYSGGVFSQIGGEQNVTINVSSSSIISITKGWKINWALQTEWSWDDVDWIDVTTESWGANGEHLTPHTIRIGVNSKAIENDMEIDSWEVRGSDNRLLSSRGSTLYPFEIATGSSVEVSGTVRFEDSNSRPSKENYLLAVQVDGGGNNYQTLATSGDNGVWNCTVPLTIESGYVNLSVWIIRPGPQGVSLNGATDATKDRTPVMMIIDSNSPTLGPLMVHTPSGARLADGNVWPEDRLLPISVEVTELEALGGPLKLHLWREGIDDYDGDSEADEFEYLIYREFTPMKSQGTVRIYFPAISLASNGDMGRVSLFVTGTDLAGHSVINGGGPGIENDMATLITQDDRPTTLSLPSIELDRWGDNLLVGHTHKISFSLTDDNGVGSLDNISVSLASGDSRGDIWIDPLSNDLSVNPDSPINPVDLVITELAAGSFNIAVYFSIDIDFPKSWNETNQHPAIYVYEHGQLLELGSDSLYHLSWSADGRVELIVSGATDLSPPSRGLVDGKLYLQPNDRFNLSGRLIHLANNENVSLFGNWQIEINMDDKQNNPVNWLTELISGNYFNITSQVEDYRWISGNAIITANLIGGEMTNNIEPMVFEIIIDNSAPVIEIPETTLANINSNQMNQQLVTVQIREMGGMGVQPIELHWSFRRHGVEIIGMHGVVELPLVSHFEGIWTYSSRIDFDVDVNKLYPGDDIIIWIEGGDLAGHPFMGIGSKGNERMPQLRVIYFKPVLSDLTVHPYQPLVGSQFTVEGRVFNEGNDLGSVTISLLARQSIGDGTFVLLNETNISLSPQQHSMFAFTIEAWDSGDLQLYVSLNGNKNNLTSVPVGMVREQSTSEALLSSLNTPGAIGFLILIISVIFMGIFAYSRQEKDWDEEEDEIPSPPQWGLNDWPEDAGPPPEILTSSRFPDEEE